MPLIDKHPDGSFCWMELSTSDPAAAKQFYSSLFGWEIHDQDMGPAGTYTIFRMKGRDCAAAIQLQSAGVPPHWMLYISTSDVDEASKRVTELGGKVVMGPFDAGEFGRMSIIQDPEGAHFSLWQARKSSGIGIAGEAGAFCWADLMTRDREAARKFYTGLFGWKPTPGKDKPESGYWHIENGDQMIGGIPPEEAMRPGMPPHWSIYYQVANCDATTAKAQGLGAQVFLSPTKIEGAGVMSVIADPQGAVFALFESTM
jgi:predicted enzyme related to lactoylglutathione lyase